MQCPNCSAELSSDAFHEETYIVCSACLGGFLSRKLVLTFLDEPDTEKQTALANALFARFIEKSLVDELAALNRHLNCPVCHQMMARMREDELDLQFCGAHGFWVSAHGFSHFHAHVWEEDVEQSDYEEEDFDRLMAQEDKEPERATEEPQGRPGSDDNLLSLGRLGHVLTQFV